MQSKLFLILVLNSLRACLPTKNITGKEKQIRELEQEKSDLYQKINIAIEDGVKALKAANDSDSLRTVENMMVLKNQIKELNSSTDFIGLTDTDAKEAEDVSEDSRSGLESLKKTNSSDVRRSNLGTIMSSDNHKININLDELANRLQKKGLWTKNKELDTSAIKNRFDEWLLKKRQSKAKQQLLKNKYEKCPRFGSTNKKSRKKGQEKYPCCRKCCKSSYLGCL